LSFKEEKDQLEKSLEGIEAASGKGKRKWIRSRNKEKFEYLSLLRGVQQLSQSVFYSEYHNSTDYEQLTVKTIGSCIDEYIKIHGILDYRATIVIDGLNQKTGERTARSLRKAGIHIRKVRGEKDDNNALLRLSDALAGGIREAKEINSVAKKYVSPLSKEGILIEIKP